METDESADIPECTKAASTIQAIDKKSVHRICSGQVVLTLSTAVKELVENSIDAGATSVEVRLKEYGSESIEVIDNGFGVEQQNFEGLTLKHHTSKLQDFNDLVNVETFGFRGEALSSLCALSNMVITTRHKSADIGTRLEFDLNGRIISQKPVSRQVGTTVIVQNIFHTLPVRHKEFARNLKKEFIRLVQVLNAYCIVNTGVRITCSNQTAKGSRSVVVSTNGNQTMKENIANVFSVKQISSLLEFHQIEPDESLCEELGLKPNQVSQINFRIEGFVSKCEHGQGRSSSDRQFIFINKRPCDATKVIKLINEVYHSYNRHQNPFIALNITMEKESVDVNVTPDKRQIFMEGERLLWAVIKASLIKMFEATTSTYKMHNILNGHNKESSPANISVGNDSPSSSNGLLSQRLQKFSSKDSEGGPASTLSNSLMKLKRSFSSAFAKNDSSSSTTPDSSNKKSTNTLHSLLKSSSVPSQDTQSANVASITQFLSKYSPKKEKLSSSAGSFSTETQCDPISDTGTESSSSILNPSMDNDVFVIQDVDGEKSSDIPTQKDISQNGKESSLQNHIGTERNNIDECDGDTELVNKSQCVLIEHTSSSVLGNGVTDSPNDSADVPIHEGNAEYLGSEMEATVNKDSERLSSNNNLVLEYYSENKGTVIMDGSGGASIRLHQNGIFDPKEGGLAEGDRYSEERAEEEEHSSYITDRRLHEESKTERTLRERTVTFSLSRLEAKIKAKNSKQESTNFHRGFRAKINPEDNKSAEEELQREISKSMFAEMEILGQFNLGFIITRLGSDLFIVDQHATDEKYNFEMLQKHTVIQSQRMIVPQSLDLTSSNETILVDNLDIFKKNGFDFIIKPDAPPTQRVQLISAPVSKNWNFGKEDIEELLFMLTDTPNVMCRPSRVRMMFASRACRKSIMIGTALKKSEMKTLVYHMGELDQPWNCPHGRPTMRHLFNMDMLPST